MCKLPPLKLYDAKECQHPRKGQRYTLLLDGGLIKGWGSKTLNNTSLSLGGNQNLRPSCRRPPARTFHTPIGHVFFMLEILKSAPSLKWEVVSPNSRYMYGEF